MSSTTISFSLSESFSLNYKSGSVHTSQHFTQCLAWLCCWKLLCWHTNFRPIAEEIYDNSDIDTQNKYSTEIVDSFGTLFEYTYLMILKCDNGPRHCFYQAYK